MNILIYTKHGAICPECNHTKINHDFKRCESYCINCGLVCIDTSLNAGYLDYFKAEVDRLDDYNLNSK